MEFECKPLDDKTRMTDMLNCEKYAAGLYNTFLCETVSGSVRTTLSSLLEEQHRMQESIFSAMQTRSWYDPAKAEDTKVDKEKQKYRTAVGN